MKITFKKNKNYPINIFYSPYKEKKYGSVKDDYRIKFVKENKGKS